MTSITIRNLPYEVQVRLRQRAALAGRSLEAEIRSILIEASLPDEQQGVPEKLQEWVAQQYGDRKPARVVDDLLAERRWYSRRE